MQMSTLRDWPGGLPGEGPKEESKHSTQNGTEKHLIENVNLRGRVLILADKPCMHFLLLLSHCSNICTLMYILS